MPKIPEDFDDYRHNRTLQIGGSPCLVSFLHLIQTIIFTPLDIKIIGGTIVLDHHFDTKTPTDAELTNEINNFIQQRGEL